MSVSNYFASRNYVYSFTGDDRCDLVNFNGKIYRRNNSDFETISGIAPDDASHGAGSVDPYWTEKENYGDNGMSYSVRLKFYKDKNFVKVDYTLENENYGWSYHVSSQIHNLWIDSAFVKTTLNGLNSTKTVAFDGYSDQVSSDNYCLLQTEDSDGSTKSYDFNFSIKKGNTTVADGDKYNSFADLRDNEKGMMVASRWFWQNHPKSICVSNNIMKFDIISQGDQLNLFSGGVWKTHELIYYFHSTDTTFENELATLKKRLIAKASDLYFACSDFFACIAPGNIETDYTFPGGEPLAAAIDAYNENHRAKYHRNHITNPSAFHETILSMRENRTILIRDSEYANFYGWYYFGDMPRGNGWGYCAQAYSWSYIPLLGFLRFDDYEMFDVAEEFVSHKADICYIHDPYATSGFAYEYHGGHRFESSALMYYSKVNSYVSAARKASHAWSKAPALQYLLTGDEKYKKAAIEHYDHISRVKNNLAMRDSEMRNPARGMGALINGYQLTGEEKYLNDAYQIFTNSWVVHEGGKYVNDGTSGWVSHSPNVHFLYLLLGTEPIIRMHNELKELGRTSRADYIKNYFIRSGTWMTNDVYTAYEDPCGSYSNSFAQYFPYTLSTDFDTDTQQHGTINDSSYSMPHADLFAFLYNETGNHEWLNLARNIFKDHYIYGSKEWKDVKTNNYASGLSSSQTAYMKMGKTINKPLYYLRTEWNESGCIPEPGLFINFYLLFIIYYFGTSNSKK